MYKYTVKCLPASVTQLGVGMWLTGPESLANYITGVKVKQCISSYLGIHSCTGEALAPVPGAGLMSLHGVGLDPGDF